MQGPRTTATAWAVIQGIEAAYMIRKGQGLVITRHNLHGQAWLFGKRARSRLVAVFISKSPYLAFQRQMQHCQL